MAKEAAQSSEIETIEIAGVEIKEYTLDDLVLLGREIVKKETNICWELGDLAVLITSKAGPKYLTEFAKHIGKNARTIRRYRDVAKAYPKKSGLRERWADVLSFSHYKEVAARVNKAEILEKAASELWSVERLSMYISPYHIEEIKPIPPKPTMEFCRICWKWAIVDVVEQRNLCPTNGRCVETPETIEAREKEGYQNA